MPSTPDYATSQKRFTLDLRFRIDTARAYPTTRNRREAVELAQSQPATLASRHVQHNLGKRRLEWLETHGVQVGIRTDMTVPDITT